MSEDDEYAGLVDAYVIIIGATKEYIDNLIANAGPGKLYRYAAAVSGDWDGFVAMSQQGLSQVEDTSASLRTNPTTVTYIGHYPPPGDSLKWSMSFLYEAIVAVRVKSGYNARAVADELREKDWCEGVAVVAAPFDILVGVGADTFSGLNDALNDMAGVDGVKSKNSHYVLRSNEYPDGPPPIG
jgi:hypothetical protein